MGSPETVWPRPHLLQGAETTPPGCWGEMAHGEVTETQVAEQVSHWGGIHLNDKNPGGDYSGLLQPPDGGHLLLMRWRDSDFQTSSSWLRMGALHCSL